MLRTFLPESYISDGIFKYEFLSLCNSTPLDKTNKSNKLINYYS